MVAVGTGWIGRVGAAAREVGVDVGASGGG